MRTRTAAVALAAGLALAGCSSSSGGDAKPSPSPSAPPSSTAATPTPTPSPTPTAYQLGQAYRWGDSGSSSIGTTTVLAYRQPVLTSDPPGTSLGVPAGSHWGRIDLRVCLTSGEPVHVTQDPWHVQFPDGSQADETGLFGGNFPKPEFPQDRVLQPGQCARGGILFPIPKGQQRPVQVVYSPDSIPTPTYWNITKR